jgi:hypothetical protein
MLRTESLRPIHKVGCQRKSAVAWRGRSLPEASRTEPSWDRNITMVADQREGPPRARLPA